MQILDPDLRSYGCFAIGTKVFDTFEYGEREKKEEGERNRLNYKFIPFLLCNITCHIVIVACRTSLQCSKSKCVMSIQNDRPSSVNTLCRHLISAVFKNCFTLLFSHFRVCVCVYFFPKPLNLAKYFTCVGQN